jgi:anti-sigma factor RsiW
MNECQNIQQQLDEYLSGRLDDFASRRIEGHLRHCAECAEDAACFRDVIGELRAASEALRVEPSLALQYRLERLSTTTPAHEPLPTHYYEAALMICGIMMIVVASLLGVLNHFGTTQVSLMVSGGTALIGSAALGGGLVQLRRKKQKLN